MKKSSENKKPGIDYSPLTRAGVAALAVGAGLASLQGAVEASRVDDSRSLADQPHREYVVQPGDRLWDIARLANPDNDHDIRVTVSQIRGDQPQRIDPGNLQPGEIILLPEDARIGTLVNPAGNVEGLTSSAD